MPLSKDLLSAAQRLAKKGGIESLTMEHLAQEVGLSRTTLYRRTGGRDALLDALEEAGFAVGDRSDARTRILQAARTVFGRTGFAASNTEEIAQAAKVSVMTVYRHFGDKEGLASAVLQELGPKRALREAGMIGDLRVDLPKLVENILVGFREDASLVRWMLIEAMQESAFLPRVRALQPTRTVQTITRLFAAHISEGKLRDGDAAQMAHAFVGMVMAFGVLGPIMNKLPHPDPAPTAQLITDLFLDGALPPKE